MNSCHLDYKVEDELGYRFYRANNSSYGNPRYVIHFLAFHSDYDEALKLAKTLKNNSFLYILEKRCCGCLCAPVA